MTSAVFDAETAARRVVAALLPLADTERAGQAKRYLKSDLLVTRMLHEYLLSQLGRDELDYQARLITPLTPLLVGGGH